MRDRKLSHRVYQRHKRATDPREQDRVRINNARALDRRNANKARLIELFGPNCVKCGIRVHQNACDFHHENPAVKQHNVATLLFKPFPVVYEEAKKCILVCSNCHRDIHRLEGYKRNSDAVAVTAERDLFEYAEAETIHEGGCEDVGARSACADAKSETTCTAAAWKDTRQKREPVGADRAAVGGNLMHDPTKRVSRPVGGTTNHVPENRFGNINEQLRPNNKEA